VLDLFDRGVLRRLVLEEEGSEDDEEEDDGVEMGRG
jgi:hypothetical protein